MDKLSVVIAVARSIPYNHDDRTVVVILTYISMHAEISIVVHYQSHVRYVLENDHFFIG